LTSVFFVNERKGWAVGHDAQILVSDDAGSTWTRQFEDLGREASADWPGEVRHVMGSRMDTVPVVVISGSW
ncbi:hypothetical protein KGZ13_34145, partial [Pseudomonas aeruginosa]|nr:hypothetical protein [Pseudomonas aeruginosa]